MYQCLTDIPSSHTPSPILSTHPIHTYSHTSTHTPSPQTLSHVVNMYPCMHVCDSLLAFLHCSHTGTGLDDTDDKTYEVLGNSFEHDDDEKGTTRPQPRPHDAGSKPRTSSSPSSSTKPSLKVTATASMKLDSVQAQSSQSGYQSTHPVNTSIHPVHTSCLNIHVHLRLVSLIWFTHHLMNTNSLRTLNSVTQPWNYPFLLFSSVLIPPFFFFLLLSSSPPFSSFSFLLSSSMLQL